MNKKLAVLFISAILLSCCGCVSKETETSAVSQRSSFNLNLSSDPGQWEFLNPTAGFTGMRTTGTTNEFYENVNLSLSPDVYQTYYESNDTISIKGIIPAKSLPGDVLITDNNIVIWFDPIVVNRSPEVYENVLFSGCIVMSDPHEITLQASLVDANNSIMNTSGKLASDKQSNSFKFYYPVKNIGDISGIQFNATYAM